MSKSDQFKFRLWNPAGTVQSLIKRWIPEDCRSEKDFENSLYDFLHRELPDIQITKQYAKGRVRADMLVSDNVILEIKANLDSTGEYQRALGQLLELKEWSGIVILLLVGASDPNLVKALRAHTGEWTDGFFFEPKVRVIEKHVSD